jgi:signal peptidase II
MASRKKNRSVIAWLSLTIGLFAIDQATKAWALASLKQYQSTPFLGQVLKFYLVGNDSAAFSISLGATWIFTIISTIAALVIIWLLMKTKSNGWNATLAVLLAGVVGNLADRLFRTPGFPVGKVVDFLQIPFNFPIFNFADICITTSMTVVVILVMRGIKLRS